MSSHRGCRTFTSSGSAPISSDTRSAQPGHACGEDIQLHALFEQQRRDLVAPGYFAAMNAPETFFVFGVRVARRRPRACALTLSRSPARIASKNSLLIARLGAHITPGLKHLLRLGHFPAQMVDVEQQQRLRVSIFELIECLLLPAFGQIFRPIDVFGEEAFFVRYLQMVQHGLDHLEMGNQNGLRKVAGKLFVLLGQTRPKRGAALRMFSELSLATWKRAFMRS